MNKAKLWGKEPIKSKLLSDIILPLWMKTPHVTFFAIKEFISATSLQQIYALAK